jgi:beta-glucanase (GH16 family)
MSDAEEILGPVHFEHQGNVYRGEARFKADWHHIWLLGRLLKTGAWDSSLAYEEMGDDRFEITPIQFEALRHGRSIQVDFGFGQFIEVKPGEYAPAPDDRVQGELF